MNLMKKKQLTSNPFLKSFSLVFIGAFGYWFISQISGNSNSVIKNNVEIKYANKYLDHSNKKEQDLDQSFSGKAYAIDGDSLMVAGNEVRLFGIDAPEYSQKCLNADNIEYPCGMMAKKYTSDLVKNKEVTCYYHIKDFYNRYLAKCYIDNIEIYKTLLKNGMAIIYSYQETDGEAKAFENQAKDSKIGIWQGAFEDPKDYRRHHKRQSKL
jgi:endonuclease YncB( thermonuclease family)